MKTLCKELPKLLLLLLLLLLLPLHRHSLDIFIQPQSTALRCFLEGVNTRKP
jgi:hypothetical protein